MQAFNQRFRNRPALILVGLTLLALALRLYQLDTIPPGLSGDEMFNATDAVRIGRDNLPIFLPGNFGREVLYHYVMALFIGLFGPSVWTIRLPAVLFGTGSVIFTYLNGRKAFNPQIGLIAGVLIAVSLWPLMQSRWALRAVSLTFFSGLIVYFILCGLHHNRWRDWIVAGIGLGLVFYTYIPGRAFFGVVLGWLLLVWLLRRPQIKHNWRQIGVMWLVALLIFAPFGWYMWQHPDLVNQRISVVNADAVNGNWLSLLTDLRAGIPNVLRMFTIQGDTDFYYHLAHRPVFDPITGFFFYVGAAVTLVRSVKRRSDERRPEYLLLWGWLLLMLLPNMLTDVIYSFLRGAGAIIPVYLIAAIGIDTAVTHLSRRWPRTRPFLLALLTIGLITTAVFTWRDYAVGWGQAPEVVNTYNGELASMGRFLSEAEIPDNTRVFIAYEYVYDWPTQFALNIYTAGQPVALYDRDTTFAWSEDQTNWHLIPQQQHIPLAAARQLATLQANGRFSLLQPNDLFNLTPAIPQTISFANGPTLTGYTLPDPVVRGETLPLLTYWQILPNLPALANELLFMNITLHDAQGKSWQHVSHLIGYPQAGWQAGDRFVQQIALPVPEGMPPGAATLQFALTRLDGSAVAVRETAVSPSTFLVQNPVDFALYDITQAAVIFDDLLAIDQTAMSGGVTPGIAHDFAIDWVKLRPDSLELSLLFELRHAETGEIVASQRTPLGAETYPYALWQANERVTTQHRLAVPLELEGITAVDLTLTLLQNNIPVPQAADTLAELIVAQREHRFDLPAIPHPTTAIWEDGISLLGYDLASSRGEVQLTLVWQAHTTPTYNYTVFTHILNGAGEMVAQLDGPPSGAAWLTMTWLPGEVVIDPRTIPLPSALPAGSYAIRIGLYDGRSGDRLPVSVDGVLQPDAALLLSGVEMEQ